jgi:hypothetical protein
LGIADFPNPQSSINNQQSKEQVTMMNLNQWFHDQLQASAEGFVWGAEQVPSARRDLQPPEGLGEWTAARHIFHLWYYEQTIALPSMRQWLGDSVPAEIPDEDVVWSESQPDVESLLTKFKKVRSEQIALLPKFNDTLWQESRQAVWPRPVTLLWVVSKTYQHTAEHINDVMRIALFWDSFAARQKAKGSS